MTPAPPTERLAEQAEGIKAAWEIAELLASAHRAGMEEAARMVELKREEVLRIGHDAAWTEPYVELAAAIRKAMEEK